jgi:hypothetical protein
MSIEAALRAVKKETGYDLTAQDLQDLMDVYKSMTSSAIQHRIFSLQKGEHGGDTPGKTAMADDLRIVLAARQALGKTTMSGATMGLDTADERQHARAMAAQMLALGREGSPIVRAEARGYMMAIRDLAVDEGATELAQQVEGFLKELK